MGAKRARLGWNAGKGGEVTYVDAAPSGTLLLRRLTSNDCCVCRRCPTLWRRSPWGTRPSPPPSVPPWCTPWRPPQWGMSPPTSTLPRSRPSGPSWRSPSPIPSLSPPLVRATAETKRGQWTGAVEGGVRGAFWSFGDPLPFGASSLSFHDCSPVSHIPPIGFFFNSDAGRPCADVRPVRSRSR